MLSTTAEDIRGDVERLMQALAQVIVGQHEVIEAVLIGLLCGGHVLLEGLPGLGKTLLVKSLGQVLSLQFSRIQCTPDVTPTDILGTSAARGPIFTQLLLADEINRATPKTQSALLEAMQEQRVTVAGTSYPLQSPFMVLATQNPIEMEGTYPLPEAQLDRFLLKVNVQYPPIEELTAIVARTTQFSPVSVQTLFDADRINSMKAYVQSMPVADEVIDSTARLVLATHPDSPYATDLTKRYVLYGSSPRGAQSLIWGGKMQAIMDGRETVRVDDLRATALHSLRHRIILNFEGTAAGVEQDDIIWEILEKIS